MLKPPPLPLTATSMAAAGAPSSSAGGGSGSGRRRNNNSADSRIVLGLVVFVLLWMLSVAWFLFSHGATAAAAAAEGQQNLDSKAQIIKLLDANRQQLESLSQEHESDLDLVTKRLKYWHLPNEETRADLFKQPPSLDRYLLFLSDCGGFNNIRMAFEYFYMTAWLTKRTLVLPPPHGWYLIDFGPMAVMKKEDSDSEVTDYSDFFDLKDMQAAVPVISADEYRKIMAHALPANLLEADFSTKRGRSVWKEYVKDSGLHKTLAWSPLSHIVYFPSIAALGNNVPSALVHHRKPVEFTPEIYSAKTLSFPSCEKSPNKAWEQDDMRFLGQMAAYGAFADKSLGRAFKRTLRDHVHFPPIVFEVAARVVKFLGLFQYSAMHVRRNELQYKEVFMSADALYDNVRPLLMPKETLYIATDETDPEFFKSLTQRHGHAVYKWEDFFTERGGNVLRNVNVPRKLIGCIEQVICSGGRAFMGTLESTYTSYIFRLRGYVRAPNDEVYFHTLRYTGNVEADRQITWSKKPERGQVYQTEHRYMWEDLG